MASLNHIFYGILILQIYVHAAPSDVGKFEDTAKVEELSDNHDSPTKEAEAGTSSTESLRQKRYFNPYGYGFPPINPLVYSSFKRDADFSVPNYGVEDPFLQLHRRVQELANVVRQPHQPPQNPHIPHIPIFYPVLFIPPGDCACNPQGNTSTNNPPDPNVTNRFPEMEDERQNWGIVTNDADENNNGVGDLGTIDFARPISFDPIRLNRPTSRPPPPVEHGTLQSNGAGAGANAPQPGGGVNQPPLPQNNVPPSHPSAAFSPGNQDSSFNAITPQPSNPQIGGPSSVPPTRCDTAILTCCHQPQVVYDCFASQGCPNITSFGNPCNKNALLRVIEKFQRFYGQRSE